MSDINTSKVDGNTVSASEFNQLAEIDNLISTSGQTPSTSNLEQQAIASARYSSAGNFFTDSGTANAYVLSPVSPFKSPVSSVATETYFNGMVIRFRAGNACSGASTVNVNNAGSKSLVKSDGSTNLTTGDIPANTEVEFVYNGTNFVQVLGKVPATTTTEGVIEIATNAETLAGTDTERAIVPSALASLFGSSVRSNSGYARLPVKVGGAFAEIIIQWAVGTFSATGTANSFPLAFPNSVFAVVLGNTDIVTTIFGTGSITNSGFTGSKNGAGSAQTFYVAIGY